MKLRSFMMSDNLYVILHIPLFDKSLQFNLYIPLVHLILKKAFKYSIQGKYLAIRSDLLYTSFKLNTDIMACQVSNGQFCHINSPLYTTVISNSYSYALFLQDKERINMFCILSVINQTQNEAFDIDNNFWAISTLHDNKNI